MLNSIKGTQIKSVYELLRGLCGVWLMERKADAMDVTRMMAVNNVERESKFKNDPIAEEIELEFKEFSDHEDALQRVPTYKGLSRRPQDEGY